MIERPDPDVLLAGDLGRWLAGQDAERRRISTKVARIKRFGWIAGGIATLIALVLGRGNPGPIVMTAGVFAMLTGAAVMTIKQPVLRQMKGAINQAIASALGLQYTAQAPPGDNFARAKAFEMLPSHNQTHFEDRWWGDIAGRPFSVHEAVLRRRTGSGKNRRTITVFAGSLMSIGFARAFTGTTLIERQGRHQSWFGGEKQEITLGGTVLQRADMVDPRFEDAFGVWSNDPVEARYLVHPEYVERLIGIEEAYAGKNIRALFHGGELLIVLESGNLFESGSLDAADDRRLIEQTIHQFATLAELAARLNERERAGF